MIFPINTSPMVLNANNAFDAEYHIGLVAGDSSNAVATSNRIKLNAALASCWDGAAPFKLADGRAWQSGLFSSGRSTNILAPITFKGRPFYFRGELLSAVRNGCGTLIGVPNGFPDGDGVTTSSGQGGNWTRFTRTDSDPDTGRGILRVRGCGFQMHGIQLNAYPLTGNIHSGVGNFNQFGILIEGREDADMPTGKHVFSNVTIVGCEKAIGFINGYWNASDVFTNTGPQRAEFGNEYDGNHADESEWINIKLTGCKTGVWSNNLQALSHRFWSIAAGPSTRFTPTNEEPFILADCEKGGLWNFGYTFLPSMPSTLLRVKWWSPNTNRISFDNIQRDGGGAANQIFRLFEYGHNESASFLHWRLFFQGHIADEYDRTATTATALRASLQYDPAELIKVPSDVPIGQIYMNINNLPVMTGAGGTLNGFTHSGFNGSSMAGWTWNTNAASPWVTLAKP